MALPASVGQPALMALYRQLAAAVGVEVCQILVSKPDLDSARAMADLGSLLDTAAGRGLLPVINGNDVTDPLRALDNDQIAVAVAVAAEADRLLFLTDVRAAYRDADFADGLRTASDVLAAQSRVQSHTLAVISEPVVSTIVGLLVGLTVISLFMPLIKLLNDLS